MTQMNLQVTSRYYLLQTAVSGVSGLLLSDVQADGDLVHDYYGNSYVVYRDGNRLVIELIEEPE